MGVNIKRLLAKDPVLWISAGLALGSMAWSFPRPLAFQDIDLRTLGLLFSLMAVVAGLSRQGLMARLAALCTRWGKNTRRLCLLLTVLSFFSAMIVTNDVALVTFVPLTLAVMAGAPPRQVIWTIALQTAAMGGLLLLCVAAVLRLIPYPPAVAAAAAGLLIMDRRALGQVDYSLLITFCFFFIFVGNLSRLPQVNRGIALILAGRETLAAALISQVISNVPAALMLSPFTQAGKALLKGVNIGGLGTLIASMASLISFKLYARSPGAQVKRYIGVFTAINFALLALLLLAGG